MSQKERIILPGGNIMPLRTFIFDWFCDNPTICMIAKRNSGKSWVCRCILKHFSYLPGGVIIAPTDRMSSFYGKFFPSLYIHYKYSTELLREILFRQETIIDKAITKYKKGKKLDPRAFLIMDDCLATKGTWANDPQIAEVFLNGRHYQLLFILTMQFPLGIKPELRGNFDYIFLLADDYFSNQKKLFDHYAGIFPSFDIFRQVFLQITCNYGCMVIVRKGNSPNILDKVFKYKATNENIRKIGCKQFRDFAERNYNKRWKYDTSHNFDVNTLIPQKKGHKKIIVPT